MMRAPRIAIRCSQAVHRVRNRFTSPFAAAIYRHQRSVLRRTLRTLGPMMKTAWIDAYSEAEDVARMTALFERWNAEVLTMTHAQLSALFDEDVRLEDRPTREFLRASAQNVTKITSHTRDVIRGILEEAGANGWSWQTTRDALQGSTAFNKARSHTIALTEMGEATNRAAIASYRAHGDLVKGIIVFDSTKDAACAAWAGKRVPIALADTVPLLGHPRCVRSSGALLDVTDLEEEAA